MEKLGSPQEIKDFIVSTIQQELTKNTLTPFSYFDKELIERMVRIEEELKIIHQRIDDNKESNLSHFAAIEKRFQLVDKRFEQVERRFDQVDKRFEQVDKRFEQVDKRFEQVERRFEMMERRFERLDNSIKWLFGFTITFITLLMTLYKFFI